MPNIDNSTHNNYNYKVDIEALADILLQAGQDSARNEGQALSEIYEIIRKQDISNFAELISFIMNRERVSVKKSYGSFNYVKEKDTENDSRLIAVASKYYEPVSRFINDMKDSSVSGRIKQESGDNETGLSELQGSLSVTAINCLRRAGIDTLDDLMDYIGREGIDGLKHIRGLGKKTQGDIARYLEETGKCQR